MNCLRYDMIRLRCHSRLQRQHIHMASLFRVFEISNDMDRPRAHSVLSISLTITASPPLYGAAFVPSSSSGGT